MRRKKEIEKKIDDIALNLEKSKIGEYVDLFNNRKKLLYLNFGMAVGFTILGALVVYFLQRLIKLNIPLIGSFIAEIVNIVQYYLH